MSEPQKILVIETLYLGDLIHTLPLIQALRVRYPSAELDVLCRAVNAPLLAHVRGIDRVREMDPNRHKSVVGLVVKKDNVGDPGILLPKVPR